MNPLPLLPSRLHGMQPDAVARTDIGRVAVATTLRAVVRSSHSGEDRVVWPVVSGFGRRLSSYMGSTAMERFGRVRTSEATTNPVSRC